MSSKTPGDDPKSPEGTTLEDRIQELEDLVQDYSEHVWQLESIIYRQQEAVNRALYLVDLQGVIEAQNEARHAFEDATKLTLQLLWRGTGQS